MNFEIGYIFEAVDGIFPEGCADWCNENGAYLEELESVDGVRRFQIVAVPEPTEEERLLQSYKDELAEKEQWLHDHDYIGTKIATGRATAEEYSEEIATMTDYAARVEELRALIEALSA